MQKSSCAVEDGARLLKIGLTNAEVARAYRVRYEKAETICREGCALPFLLYILTGRAKVYVSVPSGRALLLSFYEGEGTLGDVELLTGGVCTTTVEAVTRLTALAVPVRVCRAAMETNHAFLLHLGQGVAKKLERSSRNSAKNQLLPLENRLADYIIKTQQDGVFSENLTALSSLLGVSYRHLLRTLEQLRDRGILQKTETGDRILLETALFSLADGEK